MEVPSKCANGGLPSAAAASPAAKVAAEDDSASGASVNNSRKDGVSTGGGTLLQMHKPLAHLLAHRQWWKVCWVYGDQQKYYY